MATSVVQYGRRRGSSAKAEVDGNGTMPPPDLRQVTILSRAEWMRIRGGLNHVNKHEESAREAAQERHVLHQRSQEAVKLMSNTIEGQRQKKLQAKKIRDELEEEQRKLTDIEEAKYQQEMRKETIARAKAQQFYLTDRVKGFHSALLMTEVLKEREAQLELQKRIRGASTDIDKSFLQMEKRREEEALNREKQKELQRQLDSESVADELRKQMKANELEREREKLEDMRDGQEMERLREVYLSEESTEQQKKTEQKRNIMLAHLDHVSNRDVIRAIDTQHQEVEEKQRQLFASAKWKMMKLRKDKEAEIARATQEVKDRIVDKLTAQLEKTVVEDELLFTKAVDEQEAARALRQRREDEGRAATLDSIAVHREAMRRTQEQRDAAGRQRSRDALQDKKQADGIYLEMQQLKAQKMKADRRDLHDLYVGQMAEKCAQTQKVRKDEQLFEEKNAEITAEEEQHFQRYAQEVIHAAAAAQRNVLPLQKAARGGIGGGLGPVFQGVRPSYRTHDFTGAEMPNYMCGTTQDIKELNETVDIQQAKRRLGLEWTV